MDKTNKLPPAEEDNKNPTEAAKNAAMRAALAVGRGSRGMAAELMRAAEIKVLRDLACGNIVFGIMDHREVEYWAAVETELRK